MNTGQDHAILAVVRGPSAELGFGAAHRFRVRHRSHPRRPARFLRRRNVVQRPLAVDARVLPAHPGQQRHRAEADVAHHIGGSDLFGDKLERLQFRRGAESDIFLPNLRIVPQMAGDPVGRGPHRRAAAVAVGGVLVLPVITGVVGKLPQVAVVIGVAENPIEASEVVTPVLAPELALLALVVESGLHVGRQS